MASISNHSSRLIEIGEIGMVISTRNHFFGFIQKRSKYLGAIPAAATLLYPAALFALYRSFWLGTQCNCIRRTAVGYGRARCFLDTCLWYSHSLSCDCPSTWCRPVIVADYAEDCPPRRRLTLIGETFYVAGLCGNLTAPAFLITRVRWIPGAARKVLGLSDRVAAS